MSWIIWESIHDYEIVLTTIKDEVCLVVVFPRFLAQNATTLYVSFYVFYPPGCPEIFHWTHIVCRFWIKCNRIIGFKWSVPDVPEQVDRGTQTRIE